MFSKPYYRHLPNLGRAALLIFALVASSTVLVWNQWPELVHDLDYVIVKAYRTGTETAWNEARVPTHDRARRIELLEELLGDLESIRKGDRLGPIKRGALDRLTAELQAQGDHARGIEWAERWVAFDDRDINGQVRLARLLYRAGERRDEGIHILGELQRRFPGDERISEAYIRMLIEQARHTEACGILLDYLRAGASDSLPAIQDWEVFWDVGDGFSPRTRKPVVGELGGDGTFELTFAIPPDSRRVRIDPPPFSRLTMSRPQLHVLGPREATVNLWEIPLYLNEMSQSGKALHVQESSTDPYWFWAMSGQETDQQLLVSFQTQLSQAPADWIRAVLALPGMALVERELTRSGDSAILDRLSHVRVQALSQSEIVLSWREPQGGFVIGSRVSLGEEVDGAIPFEAVLPGAAAASALRLELPRVVGSTITFEALEVFIEGQEAPLEVLGDGVNRPSPVFFYDVERHLGEFQVVGGNPRLELNIPTEQMRVSSVRIRGVAR